MANLEKKQENPKQSLTEVQLSVSKPNNELVNLKETKRLIELENYLSKCYDFRYNEVRNRIELRVKNQEEWLQAAELDIWHEVNKKLGAYSKEYVCNLIGSKEFSKPYNPLTSWLENLSLEDKDLPWSLNEYNPFEQLSYFIILKNNEEEERGRLVNALKNWFVAAIKCLYEPLFYSKHALVFMGPQSIGKTPFFRSFLPPGFQEFIKQDPHLHPGSKDSRSALTNSLVILIEEVDDYLKNKDNRDNHKSYMTQQTVNDRPPFGRADVSRNRIASFLATCNKSNFLNDPTGTTRWVVFEVEAFKNRRYGDQIVIEDFPMSQLWAYAYKLYREGHNPEYTDEELAINEENNEMFKHDSAEYEVVKAYLKPCKRGEAGSEFMTATQIMNYLHLKQQQVKFLPVPLGKALSRLKFDRVKYEGNKGYFVKKIEVQTSGGFSGGQKPTF